MAAMKELDVAPGFPNSLPREFALLLGRAWKQQSRDRMPQVGADGVGRGAAGRAGRGLAGVRCCRGARAGLLLSLGDSRGGESMCCCSSTGSPCPPLAAPACLAPADCHPHANSGHRVGGCAALLVGLAHL